MAGESVLAGPPAHPQESEDKKKMKKQIHFLGPRGTFTEIAVNKFLESCCEDFVSAELVPCSTITEVINNVDSGKGLIGVVPVENSIEGIVRETLDSLLTTSSKVMICRETIVKISHCLITKAKSYSEIKAIISHTQAFGQCKGFINKNLSKDVEQTLSKSTSEAVKVISGLDSSYAAIGTKIAAEHYGLPVLEESINDQKENYTKFILLCDEEPEMTGNDVTSIVVSIKNRPGALVDLLKPFSENTIDLLRIESRPSKKSLGEYLFFIDFKGHMSDKKVEMTMGQVFPILDSYKRLGSYPRYNY